MKLFPGKKKKEFFSDEEKKQLLDAIQSAEQRTSGEVRLFIESKCRFVDALDRAQEIFHQTKMFETEQRNATLIYVAIEDRQAAIFGDEGIHQKVGNEYWESEVTKMMIHFKNKNLQKGICEVITDLGVALQLYFPYNRDTDKNELPDEIMFGK